METIQKMDLLRERILNAIKPYLKSPFSAVLCSEQELNFLPLLKTRTYYVKGYVSSQNSYGAMLKTDFSVEAKFTGDDWRISDVSVGVETKKNNIKNFIARYITISIFVVIAGIIGYWIIAFMFDLL